MSIQCKNCGHINSNESKVCTWCKNALVQAKTSKIDELISKQEQLEARHKRELSELKMELLSLRNELLNEAIPVLKITPIEEVVITPKEEETKLPAKELKSVDLEDKVVNFLKTPSVETANEPTIKPIVKEEETLKEPVVLENKAAESTRPVSIASRSIKEPVVIKPVEPRKPSQLEQNFKNFIEPLYDGLDLISNVYIKYKNEGKLPIFFMTIAGILAILFGFGYLTQYSLEAAGVYQGPIKVGLGFAAALVSILIGVRLSKKDNDLKEYASALISLGVILNYVMIYYMTELGNFPVLSESLLGFLLIVANTGVAIAFTLKFEAKIIAVLFVVGGAFAPFYLNASEDGTLYYLYLWFLTLGACYVSIKIKWKTLEYIAFSISALLLEVVVFTQEPSSFLYIAYYHLFAYLFFYFTFFEKRSVKNQLDKVDLVVLSSNLGFFSWNLFSASQDNLLMLGLVYMVNAFVFVALFLKFKQELDKIGRLVLFIVIGLFIGLAIPSFFNQSVMGLFWSIEAVLLVYLGFLYGNDFIRKEGYILLGVALVKLGWHSAEIVYYWNLTLWHLGFANFIILGLVISLCWVLGQKFKSQFNVFEESLFRTFGEIIPVWMVSTFFIVLYQLIGDWSFNLLIVPIIAMFYWSAIFKTKASEVLVGLFLVASLVNMVYQGAVVFNVFSQEYEGVQVVLKLRESPFAFSVSFLNYILMGLTIVICWIVAPFQFRILTSFQKRMYRIYKEVIPIIILSVFFYVVSSFIGSWSLSLFILPIISMFYWSRRFNSKSSEVLVSVFLVAALLKLVYHGVLLISLFDSVNLFLSFNFINFILVGITILSLWIVGPFQFRILTSFEKRMYRIYKEVVPIIILSVFFYVVSVFIGSWSLSLFILPIISMFYWSRRFNSKSSEILVSVFLVASLLKLVYHGVLLVSLLGSVNLLLSFDFINFILIGITVLSIWLLAPFQFRILSPLEKKMYRFYKEVVPVFISTTFLFVMYGLVGNWSFPLAIVPLFGLIYWSKLFKTLTTVWFGYAHLLLLVLGLFVSATEVRSVHFRDQFLFAQVSLFILISSLWAIKSFFRIIGSEKETSFGLANTLRVVFFCLIPLLFINVARKIDYSLIGSAGWLSILITYFLYRKLTYLALRIELIVLTVLAFVYVLVTQDLIGSIIGMPVLITFVFLEKGYKTESLKDSKFTALLNFVPYLFAVMLWLMVFNLSEGNLSIAFSAVALILLIAVYLKDKIALVDFSYKIAINLSLVTLFLSYGLYSPFQNVVTPLFSVGYLILFGIVLHNQKGWYDLEKNINGWNLVFILHQLAIIITIAILLDAFDVNVVGPLSSVLLVVHAIVLVFIALKQGRPFINKISMVLFVIALLKIISIDISEFSMVQKVIVFLILGLLLLAASYGYVKLKKRFEVENEPINELD